MLTYPWKCTVLHCTHLGNTWKPLVLMTRHFDYCPSASEGDNQSFRSSAPVVSRCFPGGYNVKLYISRGRLAWWLLAFLHSVSEHHLVCLQGAVFLLRCRRIDIHIRQFAYLTTVLFLLLGSLVWTVTVPMDCCHSEWLIPSHMCTGRLFRDWKQWQGFGFGFGLFNDTWSQ